MPAPRDLHEESIMSETNKTLAPLPRDIWEACYPASQKIHVEEEGLRVPFRRTELSGGEPPLDVYDTSGPQGVDVTRGLPALRRSWILDRGDVEEAERAFVVEHASEGGLIPQTLRRTNLVGTSCVTQLHYAREGVITSEMRFVAIREGVSPEFVRDEIASGRAILPSKHQSPRERADDHRPQLPRQSQRQHRQLGCHLLDSARGRQAALGHDLGGGYRHGSLHWREHPRHQRVDRAQLPCAHRDGPTLSGPGEGGGQAEALSWEVFKETIIEQAEQGVDYFTIHAGVLLRYIPTTVDRLTGIVSRGGSIIAAWCLHHHQENFLYTHFRELCEIMARYDVRLLSW